MEDNYVEVKIKLKESTVAKLEALAKYINIRNKLLNHDEKFNVATMEEIIKGSTIRYLEMIETFHYDVVYPGDRNLGEKKVLKNRLKQILKERNMKQLELAELSGVDRGNLSQIINNINQPSSDSLFRIWVALDFLPFEEIFYRE